MALNAQTPMATTVSPATACVEITSFGGDTRKEAVQNDAHVLWIFAGFAGSAGRPDGAHVLTQRRGREIGLDVRVVMADIANNLGVADDLVWKAIETRLARSSDFVASVWLPSSDSFGDRRLRGVSVPDVYGVSSLSPELKAKVRLGTLTAVRTAAGT